MNTLNNDIDDSSDHSNEQINEVGTKKPSRLRRWLVRITVYPLVVYVCIVGFMAANETYLVFPGSSYPKGNWETEEFAFEEVEFQSQDGTALVGWFLPQPQPGDPGASTESPPNKSESRAVLVCHGNGENVSQSSTHNGANFCYLLNANVFEFDYRGFGKSEGSPVEETVLQDAEAALELLCEKTGKAKKDVILVGHSLGGGPAVHLANKFGCQALVLQRTYTTLPDVAAKQYPWLPVKLIMRNRFESIKKIEGYQGPVFQSHGSADSLIPIEFGKELFEAAPTKAKIFYEVPEMGHWDALPIEYWQNLVGFVTMTESDEGLAFLRLNKGVVKHQEN